MDKIQTPMFNPTDLNDESKINVLIKNIFLDKELKKLQHTTMCDLVDILDFNQLEFNKELDLSLLNRIQIESKYGTKKFDKILQLEYGKNLPEEERKSGKYPVMGSNGRVGMHNKYLIKGPVIVVGRKGSAGQTVWEEENCNPIDTTFYVKPVDDTYALKFAFYILVAIDLRKIPKLKRSTGVPGLSRKDVYQLMLPVVPDNVQKDIIKKCEKISHEYETTRMDINDFYKKIESIFLKNEIYSLVDNDAD